jgi:hypothetical protein
MKPDRSNYEIWVIDLLDGNLSDQQADELLTFLNENPDLKDEFEGIAQVSFKPGQNLFSLKASLKKSVDSLSQTQFEHLCIGYLENDLSSDQRAELLEIISNDEIRKREFDTVLKLKLKPPLYSFTGKNRLRKLTAGQKVFRLAAIGLSTAAAILVLVVVFMSSPGGQTNIEPQALTINQDTLIIPVSPSLTVKESGPVRKQQNILRSQPDLLIPEAQIPELKSLLAEREIIPPSDTAFQIVREEAVAAVSVPVTGNMVNALIPDQNTLLTYNRYATIPSPFEEDRSNVDRFFARLFHEKILKDKTAGAPPVKSYDLAVAGITGLNKLFGWQIALHRNTDENGEVRSYKFNSRLVKFTAPVKKESDSM